MRLILQQPQDRAVGKPRPVPGPESFPQGRQIGRFGPAFDRLAEVLRRDSSGMSLRADAAALAPERLLVFELRGSVGAFANAVRRVPGLELVDEEELASDELDGAPTAYLMIPDVRALRELEALWRRWQRGELERGETPWRDVFSLLRDLRPWGPEDRVRKTDATFLEEEIEGRNGDELIRLEIELVYRREERLARRQERQVGDAVASVGGRMISSARIDDISYHALLVEAPVFAVRDLIDGARDSLSMLDPVMHVRPQSTATHIEVEDQSDSPSRRVPTSLNSPILALLDGVPIAGHRLLSQHIIVDDQFDLEPVAPVARRVHGTAMSSLIVHGDLSRHEAPLPRQIHVVPVLGEGDSFPDNRLVVDVIYTAVLAMREGRQATAPEVLIVNLSLGNTKRPFQGQLSAWARLLDRLAYRFGILFLVSAGNHVSRFSLSAFRTSIAFEDAQPNQRSVETLRAIAGLMADRRLLAPAETVNGVTVGASNNDAVTAADRRTARVNIDPYPSVHIANPSSALGPGFARSVKPDFIMPGAKEHLVVVRSGAHIEVNPARPGRYAGLGVAAPPVSGSENVVGYTAGTSAATALASRTAHRIHDALEEAYGSLFTNLPHVQRAVTLKALLAHPAKWPRDTASLIRSTVGPPSGRQHVQQKDNIRRFIGYGYVDADDAVACAADRATFWATGFLNENKRVAISVPVPIVLSGKAKPHALTATLAWFTPVVAGRRNYRAVRLKLLEPTGIDGLRVKSLSDQPDSNQSNRGTLFSRSWTGDRAPDVGPDMTIQFEIQREPDQSMPIDEAVPFGVAITLTMPGVVQIYDQARARLAVRPRARV